MSSESQTHSTPRTDAEEWVDRVNWYVACLEDRIKGNVVRGLAEAEAGFDSAIDETVTRLRSLEEQLGVLKQAGAIISEERDELLKQVERQGQNIQALYRQKRSVEEQLDVSRLGEQAWADLMNWAWTIICNVSEGDWTKQNQDWQDAAVKCREQYHALLASNPAKSLHNAGPGPEGDHVNPTNSGVSGGSAPAGTSFQESNP